MPSGIAVRLGPADNKQFYDGSQLFRIYPSLGMHEDELNHVVVAFGIGIDHGKPETTVFFADANGTSRPLREALMKQLRVLAHDIKAALGNLGGSGYIEVQPEELELLRQKGTSAAQNYAIVHLKHKEAQARDYAKNNWGVFAARYAVGTLKKAQPANVLNNIDWSAMKPVKAPNRIEEFMFG